MKIHALSSTVDGRTVTMLNVKVEASLVAQVKHRAVDLNTTISAIVEKALQGYFKRLKGREEEN